MVWVDQKNAYESQVRVQKQRIFDMQDERDEYDDLTEVKLFEQLNNKLLVFFFFYKTV